MNKLNMEAGGNKPLIYFSYSVLLNENNLGVFKLSYNIFLIIFVRFITLKLLLSK